MRNIIMSWEGEDKQKQLFACVRLRRKKKLKVILCLCVWVEENQTRRIRQELSLAKNGTGGGTVFSQTLWKKRKKKEQDKVARIIRDTHMQCTIPTVQVIHYDDVKRKSLNVAAMNQHSNCMASTKIQKIERIFPLKNNSGAKLLYSQNLKKSEKKIWISQHLKLLIP